MVHLRKAKIVLKFVSTTLTLLTNKKKKEKKQIPWTMEVLRIDVGSFSARFPIVEH